MALAFGFLRYAEAPANLLLAAFAFAPLIFVFALEAGPVARFINAKVFVTLGTLSYSIYMIHPFLQARILTPLALAAAKLMGIKVFDHRPLDGAMTRVWGLTDWQGDLFTLAMLGALIGAARFTFNYIEEPGRSFVRARVNNSGGAAELKGMTNLPGHSTTLDGMRLPPMHPSLSDENATLTGQPRSFRAWVKAREHPAARALYAAADVLRSVQVPPVAPLHGPVYFAVRALRTAFAETLRIAWYTPLFQTRLVRPAPGLRVWAAFPWSLATSHSNSAKTLASPAGPRLRAALLAA